ncbi:hypothetical protein PFISCL1PPCAC_10667, partial [Pristionchus fissidentatus]
TGSMDAGVQGEESRSSPPGACNPVRSSFKDLDGDETPEQRLERQKNALLTMISVRELKAILAELEGRCPLKYVKEERPLPKRNNIPRGVSRKSADRPPGSNKRRNSLLKGQQPGVQRITTFCFDKLEIGDFKLTAPDETCAVVPGTNWIKVDAEQRIIIYQFIIARSESATPYNVTVHVSFSNIAAIFYGFPEIIIKLNHPAIQASCYQTFGSTYHIVNDLDVTEGQLARADVHKMALRASTNSLQEVLLAADSQLFSSILSNGNHLSASSSLYSNYAYSHPHPLLSDYGSSLHHSSYHGVGPVVPPISMGASIAPQHTYSVPAMNIGAGGAQLNDGSREGEVQLTQMHPMQMESSPINERDEAEFREMFEGGDILGGGGAQSRRLSSSSVKGLPTLALSPTSVQSTYVSPLMNAPYTARSLTSPDPFLTGSSSIPSSIPHTSSSSLYALSGSPIYPPSTTSHHHHPPPPSLPPLSSSLSLSSRPLSSPSYPFSSSILTTPSPLFSSLSPFFNFTSLSTPNSMTTPSFWNATMNSLRMEEFDSIGGIQPFREEKQDTNGMAQSLVNGHHKDSLEDLDIVPKEEDVLDGGQSMDGRDERETTLIDSSHPIDDNGEIELDNAKFASSEYSFSSLCNFESH